MADICYLYRKESKMTKEETKVSNPTVNMICQTIMVVSVVVGVTTILFGSCAIDGYWRTKQAEALKRTIPKNTFIEALQLNAGEESRFRELIKEREKELQDD